MKKCASCTKDLPDAALHCVFCGAKQPPAPAVAASVRREDGDGVLGQRDRCSSSAQAAAAAAPQPPPAASVPAAAARRRVRADAAVAPSAALPRRWLASPADGAPRGIRAATMFGPARWSAGGRAPTVASRRSSRPTAMAAAARADARRRRRSAAMPPMAGRAADGRSDAPAAACRRPRRCAPIAADSVGGAAVPRVADRARARVARSSRGKTACA